MGHVLSAVKPASLQRRLESDLEFTNHDLRKDFKGFMKHALKVSKEFQLVDNAPKQGKHSSKWRTRSGSSSTRSGNSMSPTRDSSTKKSYNGSRPPSGCPHPPCKVKGLKDLIKVCPDASQAEKDKMLADYRAERSRDGPARGKRSQTGASTSFPTTVRTISPRPPVLLAGFKTRAFLQRVPIRLSKNSPVP